MNPLAQELNSLCNLQNPSFKLDLIFYAHTDKKGKSKRKKIPAGLYMNGHNWPIHILCHLETEPRTLPSSICVVEHLRVNLLYCVRWAKSFHSITRYNKNLNPECYMLLLKHQQFSATRFYWSTNTSGHQCYLPVLKHQQFSATSATCFYWSTNSSVPPVPHFYWSTDSSVPPVPNASIKAPTVQCHQCHMLLLKHQQFSATSATCFY
jgi:hypothetical protein